MKLNAIIIINAIYINVVFHLQLFADVDNVY